MILYISHSDPAMAKLHHESTDISRVQRLYDASNRVFSSGNAGLPTLRHIRWLQEFLDVMEPSDVGIDALSDDEGLSDAESSPTNRNGLILGKTVKHITYIHIHECEDFSIGIFCFPAGATFPLHDHPNMVVLSKVLYGSVRSKSYDWVTTSPCSSPKKGGLAKLVSDNRLLDAHCKASVLFPRSGGNLHSFYAETPCAILDVLSPPYSDDMGRPSKYYSDIPIPNFPGYAVLKETDLPDDLTVHGTPYMGPELSVDIEFC